MKLHYPYSWNERKVLLEDRVLFVPDQLENYGQFIFPGWFALFDNEHPVKVEYCSGNGMWIVEKAMAEPQINWVAVEQKFERIGKTWVKVVKRKLTNLFMVCGEGLISTQNYFPSASIAEVFINFPDPWPKRRHWKNRIVESTFLQELKRILLPQGLLNLVTDDLNYSQVMIKEALKHFSALHPAPHYIEELPGYGSSYFEDLWRSKGKKIRYHQFYNESKDP